MPADTAIRRVTPEEWQVYRQVRLTALTEAPYAFMSTLEREQAFGEDIWRQRLGSPTAATFLAWRDSEPAGTATGIADDPEGEYAVPGAWQLVGMWVDPRSRGLGAADELVEAVASHATAEGAASLVLWVTEVNDRARAFYKRMGFVPTGARQLVRPEEPGLWEEQMIRRLSRPGDTTPDSGYAILVDHGHPVDSRQRLATARSPVRSAAERRGAH